MMTNRLRAIVIAVVLLGVCIPVAAWQVQPAVRFAAVSIVVTTDAPLAAYQLRLESTAGEGALRIVGIEGGSAMPYDAPPYYDPRAIQGDEVILGAFSVRDAADLPSGNVHVATVHVQLAADVASPLDAMQISLDVAADADGAAMDASIRMIDGVSE